MKKTVVMMTTVTLIQTYSLLPVVTSIFHACCIHPSIHPSIVVLERTIIISNNVGEIHRSVNNHVKMISQSSDSKQNVVLTNSCLSFQAKVIHETTSVVRFHQKISLRFFECDEILQKSQKSHEILQKSQKSHEIF